MKAIVIGQYGDPDVLVLRDIPDPAIGPEDVLVAVRATALNRADILQRRGFYPQPGPKPQFEVPGLEFAGEVLAAGERVLGIAVGDRVMGLLAGGGYAEKVATHFRLVSVIPDCLSYEEAAALPEALITAHDALSQCGLVCGESVLVHAAGSGVGTSVVQVAKAMGATPVIGTAGSAEKLAQAAALGLDAGINYKEEQFAERARELTGGRGVDVVVDFVGASYLAANVQAMAEKGRMVVVGLMGGFSGELPLGPLLNKRLQIRGTLLRSRPLEEKALATRAFEKSVLPHVAAGAIVPVIDSVMPLAEAPAAHRRMESNANFGKIVLRV
ncbi:MAG TPA: NAD(P)H-quinone oxidoreductase [Candidatus Limnocylindrales bacterium]|nr:NAD(P)H-quinone oxidoreductase [Candidatus Limnocylindrales bacterium]